MGRAARHRRRGVSQAARLSVRPLRFLSGEAGRRGVRLRAGGWRSFGHRAAASHQQARDPRELRRREPDRRSSLRAPSEIVRIYSTSGTTGTPSYVPLTARDLDNWVTASARSYAASGITAGQRIISSYNAGPFVAGAALAAFDRIGLCHIPVGTGNTERLLLAVDLLGPEAVVLTPSYAAHLTEWADDRGVDLRGSSVRRVLVAGEPGGGEPAFRAKLEEAWGARVTEAMGIGDIGVSLWGECEEQDGMHLGARGYVHAELIDPETGAAVQMEDGATGELVLTHLQHRAAPLLRFRTRDHVRRPYQPLPMRSHEPARALHRAHRRHAHRARRQRLSLRRPRGCQRAFAPRVSGHILVRPQAPGVKQEPPLPVRVELAKDATADTDARRGDPRAAAQRPGRPGPYRSRAVGDSAAQRVQVEARRTRSRWMIRMRKLQSQGVHHITIFGADRRTSIDFWEGVLGMPFVFEQPNLDNAVGEPSLFRPRRRPAHHRVHQ